MSRELDAVAAARSPSDRPARALGAAAAPPAANRYRQRILRLMEELLVVHRPFRRILDFGAGDGWFAQAMAGRMNGSQVVAVDVLRRQGSFYPAILYDGSRLPFADRAFDLAFAVDVVHHARDPAATLRELARTAGGLLLLKDHTYRSPAGRLALCVLDEVGNRRFGIPSVYRYQHAWEWSAVLEDAGFRSLRRIHPAACHTGLLGHATNGLQFLELWRREGS